MTVSWIDTLDDLSSWPEQSYDLGITDGLPVHPPLRSAVEAMVAATGRMADEVIGTIAPRDGEATIEAVAANAVMAGCLPEHMAVVVAAVEAMLDPTFNLRGVQTTTHGCWPLTIVSGSAADDLSMASGESVFSGGGSRASATIGRAVRLVLWNIGGSVPGEPVKEVFGHPGRYAFSLAESTESPWLPLHRARGVDAASGVTVFACESPHSVAMWGCDDDPGIRLDQIADAMAIRGSNNTHTMGECLVVMSPAEVRHLSARGFDRESVQHELYERSRRPLGEIRPRSADRPDESADHWYSWWPDWVDQSDETFLVPVVDAPSSIHVVVAGADSIPWSVVCPGWGHLGGFAVSRSLRDLANDNVRG